MKYTDSKELIRSAKYTSIIRIRGVILNIFNPNIFKEVDLLGILRNSDNEHLELFEDIISMVKGNGFFEVAEFGEQLARELNE